MQRKTAIRATTVAIAALGLASCSLGTDLSAVSAEVTKFHQLVDAGRCDEIYSGASQDLTATASAAAWQQLCGAIPGRMGRFKSSTQTGWNDQVNNGNHIVVLTYQAQYERGSATEEFDYRITSGKPALAGYHISSDVTPTA